PADLTTLGAATYLFVANNLQDPSSNQYYSLANEQDSNSVMHRETVTTTGRQTQWNAGYGANINDKFYFGFGMGIAAVKYKLTRSYQENIASPSLQNP